MLFKRVNHYQAQTDEPIMKSKEDRLSEFKWSVIRTVVYIVGFMLFDITTMSPRLDNTMIVWIVRIMYSLSFVVSLHASRTVYWIYQLENELREQGIETDDDIRRSHQEFPVDEAPIHSDETSK